MAIVRCKNTYGDGRVEYVEYEVTEEIETEDEEATIEDYEEQIARFGV